MVGLQRIDHRADVGLPFCGQRLHAREQARRVQLTGAKGREDAKEFRHAREYG